MHKVKAQVKQKYHFMAIVQDNLRSLAPKLKNWKILFGQSFTIHMPLPTDHYKPINKKQL